MKLLYCIFAICAVVNAGSVPTREQLEKLAKSILETVKHAPDRIDEFVATTELKVQEKLLKNKLVHKVKTILDDKFKQSIELQKNITDDLANCGISIINGFQKLATDINVNLLQKLTNEQYGKEGDYLSTLKTELSDIKGALENHSDEEIELCLNKKNECKLKNEYLPKSQEYFTFEDLIKPSLETAVESSDEYINSEEVGNKIVIDFTHPAHECLSKLVM